MTFTQDAVPESLDNCFCAYLVKIGINGMFNYKPIS